MADSFGYGFDEDVQVYSFLDPDINDDLGALLDEGNANELNDDTFGDSLGDTQDSVGRDFDFAGSTSRLLAPAGNDWLTGSASTPVGSHHLKQQPQQQQQQQPQQPAPTSAWAALDADPLLSSAPLPKRSMRTLEEVEAELARNQHQQHQTQPQQQQQQPRVLTMEEVEAQMLSQRQQPHQPQLQQGPPPQFFGGMPPPGQGYPQPPPGFIPGPHGMMPPPGMQGAPSPFQQHQQLPFPPGQIPPHLLHHHQARPGPPGFQQGPPRMGGPGSPFPQPQQIPGQQQQQQVGSPAVAPQQAPQPGPGGAPAPVPGQGPGPAPGQQQGGNMLQTLFPPLPSQQGRQGQAPSVEQQLQFLSIHGHAQHPSLTAAQLQSMLQQAQAQAGAAPAGGEANNGQLPGEDLIRSVEARIREHEVLEQGRKKKANKIASMAKHNNVMTNSDKDFITRIQVSQLVTDDPYADDFYFHIMAALKQSQFMAQQQQQPPQPGMPPMGPNGPIAPGGPGGPGGPNRGPNGPGGRNQRKPTRQQNAMNKMAQNVQRLVDSAKKRNNTSQLNVDGALGKIALRTRSAPRPLLQVGGSASGVAAAQSHSASTLLAGLQAGTGTGQALSHRAALAILERIYDAVLDLEQLRRIQPGLVGAVANIKQQKETAPEGVLDGPLAQAEEAVERWEKDYAELSAKLWTELRVMEPLDSCSPHPFISLVSVLKGKRILPRALRHLTPEQTLTLLTLVVATFDTLDTVVDAPILDAPENAGLEGKQRRTEVLARTEAFLNAIVAPVMGVIGNAPLRMVTGMLGLLMQRNDLKKVVRSKPGVAFLTIFLSRAESLKQAIPAPEAVDLAQWQQTFTHLFNSLMADLPSLFPSSRAVSALPFGPGYYLAQQSAAALLAQRPDVDLEDEPVWTLLAAVAVCADPNEQQGLVTGVRDKVLENVTQAKKGKLSPQVAALKIRNVNLLLHSLGLDASQLTVDE